LDMREVKAGTHTHTNGTVISTANSESQEAITAA